MSQVDAARAMHALRNRQVIEAEQALDAAIKLRDEAEQALYAAEEADTKQTCCGMCP